VRGRDRVRKMILEVYETMLDEAYYDRVKGEVVATKDYFALGVEQGEVLRDARMQKRLDFATLIRRLHRTENRC